MEVGQQGERLLERIAKHVDGPTFGRIYADLNDLTECCRWLINLVDRPCQEPVSQDEMEQMLIDIEVAFVMHVSFHLKTFRKDIKTVLASLPDED